MRWLTSRPARVGRPMTRIHTLARTRQLRKWGGTLHLNCRRLEEPEYNKDRSNNSATLNTADDLTSDRSLLAWRYRCYRERGFSNAIRASRRSGRVPIRTQAEVRIESAVHIVEMRRIREVVELRPELDPCRLHTGATASANFPLPGQLQDVESAVAV